MALDLDAVHRFIWDRSGRNHVLAVNQKQMAAEMGVGHVAFHRAVAQLVAGGQLKILGRGRSALKTFLVADPDAA